MKNGRGFSLIEMMAALSVAAILLTIGAPSFRDAIENQRVATAANDFFAAIRLARSEAMQRGTRVDLAPTDGKSWKNGWMVFIDGNGNRRRDAGERVVFSHGPVGEGVAVDSRFTDSSRPYLAYNGAGRSRTDASVFSPQSGTISFASGRRIRRIKINFLGRPRLCNPENDGACTGMLDVE